MRKSLTAVVIQFLAVGMILLSHARAQETPAAATPQPAKPPTSTTHSSAANKTSSSAKTPFSLKTQKDRESYALGMSFGLGLHKQKVTQIVDGAIVVRGLRDGIAGGKTLLTEDEMKAALRQLNVEVGHLVAADNLKAGSAFLAANKTKVGVVTLPDGLQYKILTAGNGPKPTATDTVTVNYRGTLLDGREFDSSYGRGQPVSFQVGGVIPGWTEALQLMPVGSKWQLFIPAGLAYGDNPPPRSGIEPGDTLIFEVELLSIGEQKQ